MTSLSLEQSNRIIEAALRQARALGLPPLGVAVLDSGGHLIALQREDGLSFLRVRICQAKAWGALAMGTRSRNLADRFAQDTQQQGFIQGLNAMTGGRIVTLPGGLLIVDDGGDILGALGVAGGPSDLDEACALAAIAAIGLQAGDTA